MFFDLISTVMEYDILVQPELNQEMDSLRAQIASVDEKIAFHKAEIEKNVAESIELSAEIQEVSAQSKDLQIEVMKIQSKEPKLKRCVAKYEDKTNERLNEMAEVQKTIQDARDLTANVDESAQKGRIKELLATIEARKKIMEEVGYGNGDDKRLEKQVKEARARLAELVAKDEKITDLKRQLKMEQERNADLKIMSWQKISNESKKVKQSNRASK